MSPDSPGQPLAQRLARWIERRSTLVIAALSLATAALAIPLLWMQPTASASQEPAGDLFECQRLSVDRFASSVHRAVYIVEARGGDLLRKQPLLELLEGARAVRDDPEVGPKLHTYTDPRGTPVKGIRTIADAVEGVLRMQGIGGLAKASEAQVATAVRQILDAASPRALGLSVRARRDDRGSWSAPALMAVLLADNEALGGGGQSATLGAKETTKEEFARRVQGLLRGEQRQVRVWGLAIDVNLTSAEQGSAAGPYIGLTIFAVLALVGLTFRSYWAVAVTGLSLGALIIWLKGLSNLVGLKNDQILSIIVPIAMISFGVDFAFHALGRFREESRLQVSGRRAFVVGSGGVLGALVLAMASDSAAFLANVTSGIESLVQFGVAAAMGAVAAFVMLGLFTPLVLMRIEERVGRPRRGMAALALAAVGGLLAALGAMAVVSLTVFVLPWLGVAALGGYALLFVAVPALIVGSRGRPGAEGDRPPPPLAGGGYDFMGRVVVEVARLRHLILPLVAVFSGLCAYYALKVEANFDVKDFFASTTDFVVALDKFDRHVGQQGGEPAVVYVEGRLTEPRAIGALGQFVEEARKLDTDRLAKDDAGWVRMEAGLLDLLDLASTSPAARAAVARATGVQVTDENGDRVPDTATQIAAIYRVAARQGLPAGADRPARTADQVRTALWQGGGEVQATHVDLRLPGSRVQENIREARAVLAPLVERLQQRLRQQDPGARAVLTGRPVVRQAALGAILRAFRLSLPVAVGLCLIISAIFMRSLRFAAVSIVPILLVVAWLYAFMYAFGFDINVITATIGAISIGIGIDFAVHFTMRFREEQDRRPSRREALQAAGSGTGGALLASGASSIVGFAILAFAPMPLFASYGLLTAVMILLASVASLLVLPSLLMLVTRPRGR
jgi:predicted RND superfamily exporter protein